MHYIIRYILLSGLWISKPTPIFGSVSRCSISSPGVWWSRIDPANEVELFNLRHASLRNVIERIFGIFKSRFTIFKTVPPFPFRTQTELVSACVGLHNFLRKECRSDEFPVEQDNEVDPELVNEVDPELVFQTREQQRTEANEWRDTIALNMWMDAGHNDNNENQ